MWTLSAGGVFGLIAQENKLVRVASYRQLQAMSHQLSLLTNGRIANLDSFREPPGVVLSRPHPGQQRFTRREDGRVRAGYLHEDGEEVMLLPESRTWWLDANLLVLQLDQGPTCCGGLALLGRNQCSYLWKSVMCDLTSSQLNLNAVLVFWREMVRALFCL